MSNFWTEEKDEILRENYYKMSFKSLAKKLEATSEIAVQVRAKRLGLRRKKQMSCYGFKSESDLLRELKTKGLYITHDILLGLRKSKIIECKKLSKYSYNFYSIETCKFIEDLFSNYDLLMTVHQKLNLRGHSPRMIHSWVKQDCIKTKKFEGSPLIFIHKESTKFLINLTTNYLLVSEFSKLVHYSVATVNSMIRRGIIKAVKFANKYWIEKGFIDKIKYYYSPKINQFG